MTNEIEILSELEAVRKNPGMYIGSIGEEGAHHLALELLHNAIDEALLGFCTEIFLRLDGGYCEVKDNGRGLPTGIHPTEGISSCEVALTRLHSSSKFKKNLGEFTTGLHGVGLSCVNALSATLQITVDRDGFRYQQEYERGLAQNAFRKMHDHPSTGTTVRFRPDEKIFLGFERFNESICLRHLEELSYLNPSVAFHFINDNTGRHESFLQVENSGAQGLLAKQMQHRQPLLSRPLQIQISQPGLKLDAALIWTTDAAPTFQSFVNCVATPFGGTHLNAVKAGILHALTRLLPDSTLEVDDLLAGLVAVLDCRVLEPHFEGQTKGRLTNPEIVSAIEEQTLKQTLSFFSENPLDSAALLRKIQEVKKARTAARRVAERIAFQNIRMGIDEEVYKEQFGARSKNWHDSAVWITDKKLLQAHAEMCDVDKDAIALDVCCGSGVVGASFKGRVKKIIGLDLTPQMVGLASQRLDEVHQGNVYNIPFSKNKFDLVCTREVLHLLPQPEKPVSEIFRVLKPGGQFIVGQILPFSEEDAPWMYRIFKKKQPLIYNMFQEQDFKEMLLNAGFVDLQMTELNVWESIDVWIDSIETTSLHRHEIRNLFLNAPAEARKAHPFKILPSGEIQDLWRWCVFSVRKPISHHS